jgi:hypothetical protein
MNKKKKLFAILFALLAGIVMQARELIIFSASDIKEMPVGNGHPKSPIQPPTVYIEDYTLLFAVDHPDYILNIMDEDGAVVYSTVVYSTQTQVVLPSTLSGDYEIELVMGNWLFSGWINL